QGEHLVRHIESIRLAGWADALGREQNVDTATGTQVEDRFAFVELCDSGRIATSQREEGSCLGKIGWFGLRVLRAPEDGLLVRREHGRSAAGGLAATAALT